MTESEVANFLIKCLSGNLQLEPIDIEKEIDDYYIENEIEKWICDK